MEDVGEQYLQELINRCMIQVSQSDHTRIGVKTCRMHDLMRDMCQAKAREENFLGVVEHQIGLLGVINDSSSSAIWQKARRTAVYCKDSGGDHRRFSSVTKPEDDTSHLHSLLFFVDEYSLYMTQRYCFLFKNFRLLRVLNLRNMHVKDGKLTREIGNLIYLRYLGLRSCYITQVPASTGNLQSLCTLDLRGHSHDYSRQNVPNVLWKLRCLRHLLLFGLANSVFSPCRLNTLKHLETLKMIDAKFLIRKSTLHKLTNLRHLGIRLEITEEVEEILNSVIFENGQLRSLSMQNDRMDVSYPNLEAFSQCQYLTRLKLWGEIVEDVHNSNHSHNLEFLPASLSKLSLKHSQLKQDPMPILEKLHNLRFLVLGAQPYNGSVMVCSANGFPQLELLELEYLWEVIDWRVEKGAMPNLKALTINCLLKLFKIPKGLKYVTALQKLSILHQLEAFEKRIQVANGVEGDDFYKVKHIPSITISKTYGTFCLEESSSE